MAEENLRYKTKKGIYWTFFNQMVNNSLQFIVGVIMARILSPSDYGITALPAVFLAIAATFVDSGFANALIRKPDVTERDLSTSFYYSIAVGILCYVIMFVVAPFIATFYNEDILTILIRITAITFLIAPLNTPQNVILQRKLDFKSLANISIVTKILGSIVGIALAYMGYGLWSLVAMNLVSTLTQAILMWTVVKWIPREKWSKESFKYLWGFGNKLLGSSLLHTLYMNITPILVGKFYSPSNLGVYNRAQSYALLPSQQFNSVVQSVTYPVLSQKVNDDEALGRYYRTMIKATAFVIFPLMFLMIALAKPLIIILVTEKWIDAVILLQLICLSKMWWPISTLNLNLLQVKGRSDLFFRLEIYKKLFGFLIMLVFLPIGLVAFCIGQFASQMFAVFVNTYYTGKIIDYGYLKQIKDISCSFMLSVVASFAAFSVSFFSSSLWIQLILGGIIGGIIYLAVAHFCKMEELETVRYMLNRKK